jgi:hypothetical protein
MTFADKLAQIERRGAAIRERLLQLGSLKRQHAVAATDSDQRALAAIMEVDAECNRLNSEQLVLDDAKAELEQQQCAEAEAEAQRQRDQRQGEAKQLVGEIMAVNQVIDQQLIVARQQLQRRADLLRQLNATRILAESYVQRLAQKYPVTAAARAAGLDKFVSLEYVAPPHIQPLVESNRGLTANGMAPEPKGKITRLRPRDEVHA